MAAALAAIVAVAAEQMGGEAMRAHFQIDQVELTARVLPLQACLLLATAPFLDKLLIGSFPHQYEFHVPSMVSGTSISPFDEHRSKSTPPARPLACIEHPDTPPPAAPCRRTRWASPWRSLSLRTFRATRLSAG